MCKVLSRVRCHDTEHMGPWHVLGLAEAVATAQLIVNSIRQAFFDIGAFPTWRAGTERLSTYQDDGTLLQIAQQNSVLIALVPY